MWLCKVRCVRISLDLFQTGHVENIWLQFTVVVIVVVSHPFSIVTPDRFYIIRSCEIKATVDIGKVVTHVAYQHNSKMAWNDRVLVCLSAYEVLLKWQSRVSKNKSVPNTQEMYNECGWDNSLIKSSYFAAKNLNIVPNDLQVSQCSVQWRIKAPTLVTANQSLQTIGPLQLSHHVTYFS